MSSSITTPTLVSMLIICVAGGLGAVARFFLDTCIKEAKAFTFPLSTLVINALASLLAGAIAALYLHSGVFANSPLVHTALATGFLGGFSTFSTMINESVTLFRRKHYLVSIANIIVEVIVPWSCVVLGWLMFA